MTTPYYQDERVTLYHGDNRDILATLPDNSVDSCVTDPPYELGFMGKKWDGSGIAYDENMWREVWRVLKPGGHLLAFGGTRTWHRLAVAIEDAGFEVRDSIAWMYGSGFPKSLDVSKAIDKNGGVSVAWFGPWFRKWREENGVTQKQVAALFPSKSGNLTGCVANWELGLNMPTPQQFNLIRDTFGLPFEDIVEAEREVVGSKAGNLLAVAPGQDNTRSATTLDITAPATDAAKQWQGWGTALKPAFEPVVVARKPLIGTVAANVQEYGTGALNIDACRIGTEQIQVNNYADRGPFGESQVGNGYESKTSTGRWPANVILDESQAAELDKQSGVTSSKAGGRSTRASSGTWVSSTGMGIPGTDLPRTGHEDQGGASRFFYCAKAGKKERPNIDGIAHPTVKPLALMRYLLRLVTPPHGTVLEPFAGSGTTIEACLLENFNSIAIEMTDDYLPLIVERIQRQTRNTLL